MADLLQFAEDPDKRENGRWIPWRADIEFLIASASSERFRDRMEELQAPHQAILDSAPKSDVAKKLRKDTTAQAVAECLCLGWKNVNLDGEDVPYSPEKALELFTDDRFQSIYTFVMAEGTNADGFLLGERSAGNSESGADGSLSTVPT